MARVEAHSRFSPIDVGRQERVFVLTGAGISAESGVPTFRASGGLWENHSIADVATPEAFERDPALVWRFYSERRRQVTTVDPNLAHRALSELEAGLAERLFVCTQNVDPLHERAGSQRVHHMHGELLKTRCSAEHAPPFDDDALYLGGPLPRCACGALLRPHICWFGEVPFGLELIEAEVARADVLVTIGSSGSVYPAAGLVAMAKGHGARTVYVGPERPDNASAFDECRLGTATQVVPSLFRVS